MRTLGIITWRELGGYFSTPLAYVFLVIFLAGAGAVTFYMGNFFGRGQADLLAFFGFHPWLFLVLTFSNRHFGFTMESWKGTLVSIVF